MSSIEGKVVVITGASNGLGEATARLLALSGAKVFLGARRTERLNAIVTDIRRAGGQAARALSEGLRQEAGEASALPSSLRARCSRSCRSGAPIPRAPRK